MGEQADALIYGEDCIACQAPLNDVDQCWPCLCEPCAKSGELIDGRPPQAHEIVKQFGT